MRREPAHLVVVRNPFDRRDRDERLIAVASAPTIEALVGEYLPAGSAEGVALVVSINGECLPREAWAQRTLAAGEQMVVMPVLQGGDDGMLGMVLSIGLMIVAPYIGVAMYGAMGGTFVMANAGLMASMISAGVGLLGSALIGALTAPDKPQLPAAAASSPGSYDSSPSYAWQPVTTQEPGGVVARAYGTVKLHGNIIAGYIEATGDTGREQTAHLLIDLGMGPYAALRDFKINGQPLNFYSGVTLIERRGQLNQEVIPTFNDTRLTRGIGAKVVNGAPVTRNTVGSDFDALEIVISFPLGLYYANDTGGMSSLSVQYTVEISADGGASWAPVARTPRTESAVVLSTTGQWTLGSWSSDEGGSYWHQLSVGSSVRTDHYEGELVSDGWSPASVWRWIETTTSTTIYTEVLDSITTSGASQQPIRKTFRADGLTRGISYQVRVINQSADQTDNRHGDDLYLAEINEVLYDDFEYPRTVLVAIKALATDQISGGMQFECIGDTAIVRVWNGSAWAAEFSRSPAWICWDALTQPVLDNNLNVLRYDGMDPARLDLPAFWGWAQWCAVAVPIAGGTEPRCLFDGIFDTPTSAWDAALEIAASARAVLLLRGTTVTVVWDCARTLPAQVFSVGNTSVNSFSETFLPMADRAGAIEVDFMNAEQGHERDKLTVVNAGVVEAAAQRVQFSNRGIRRTTQAWREAMIRLKKNELLRRCASLGVDIDSIACTVGDLIWVQDDVTQWGEGGRIVSGTATTLLLDKSILLAAGKSYEVVLRLADDTIVTRPISTAPGSVSSITVGSAFPALPTAYDVWAVGEAGRAVKPFLVTDIRRDGEQRATLSLIEYNASLYGVDSGIPTVPTPNLSAALATPVINNLRAEEVMERSADGVIVVHLDLYYDIAVAYRAVAYCAGTRIGESATGKIRYANVTSGATYTVSVRPLWLTGEGPPASWQSLTRTVVGKSALPANVAQLSIAGTVLSWPTVADIDLAGYRLRFHYGQNFDWGTAVALHTGLLIAAPFDLLVRPAGVVTLMIKAVDTSGNESPASANIVTDLGDAPIANVVETLALDPTYPGTLTGCSVIGGDLVANVLDAFYGTDDQSYYGADTVPFYDVSAYAQMVYVSQDLVIGSALAGSMATLAMTTQGADLQVEYRFAGPGSFYGRNDDAFYGPDAEAFFDAAGGWLPWPGQIQVANDIYALRITLGAGAVQGKIMTLALIIDAPDMVEEISDLVIAAAGTVIPYTKPFTSLKSIQATLQANASGAETIEINKASPLAPSAKAYTSAHTAVAGASADFTLKGY